jgi:O-antigen ligase
LALLAWIFAPGSLRDKVPLEHKPVQYVLILLGLAIVTIPLGVWPGQSFEMVSQWYWKSVALFLMVVFWCRSIRDLRRVIWVCCIGASALALSGLSTGEVANVRFNAESKTYDANDLALYLVIVLPLLQYLFSTSRAALKFVLVGMLFACLYGIVLTRSRGGFLAFITVGALILWQSKVSRAGKIALVVMAMLVFGGLGSTVYWDRIQTMWNPVSEYDRTAGGRTEVWGTALKLLVTSPLGVGIGAFETAEGLSHEGYGKWSAAHNSFLQVGVELGVAGLLVYVLLIARTVRDLRRVQAAQPGLTRPAPGFGLIWRAGSQAPSPPLPERDTEDRDFKKNLGMMASALEISFWGFVVGGFFLSLGYSMILYTMLGASLACTRLARLPEMRRPTVTADALARAEDAGPLGSPHV